MRPLRVMLVHDDALFRSVLRMALVRAGAVIVAETGEAAGFEPLFEAEAPDVVVSDLRIDGVRCDDIVRRVQAAQASTVVISDDRSPGQALALLRLGLPTFLSREVGVDELVAAIRATVRQGSVLDPGVAAALVADWRGTAGAVREQSLSPRESDVLRLLVEGHSTKAISVSLGVSTKTVEHHKTRLFSKLGVRNQAEAVTAALAGGLLVSEEP